MERIKRDCYWNRFNECHILTVSNCPKKCGFFETPEDFRERQDKFEREHPETVKEQTRT